MVRVRLLIMDKKTFKSIKHKILSNLDTLRIAVKDCEDMGMLDIESSLYNQADDLYNQASVSMDMGELEIIYIKAKDIEVNLDLWLSSIGKSTTALSWPQEFS